MNLLYSIALKHIVAKRRQSIVSVLGIILGVSFFLAISSLMQGSEKDFIRRLIDNAPHITVNDEFRNPHPQPVFKVYPDAAVEIQSVKPVTETRGIRGFNELLLDLAARDGVLASPVLSGQALLSFAGRDIGITLQGMIPEDIRKVSTIEKYLLEGSLDDLIANPDGIIIGQELATRLSVNMLDSITVGAANGQVKTFKILGIFRTGRAEYDSRQAYAALKRVQALLDRPDRVNRIIIKLENPYAAREMAADIEKAVSYKSVSWQESSEDLMNTLAIRNVIMYTVVSAVLLVAAFGIYNVISTIVMEKHRDIAILKSVGFQATDIQKIFLAQGVFLGFVGCVLGLPLGALLMYGLMQIEFKVPGGTEVINMPIDWSAGQFVIASAFALVAAISAAFLPARKAAAVRPIDILRGRH